MNTLLAAVLFVAGTNMTEHAEYPTHINNGETQILNFFLADTATKEAHGWYALDDATPAPREGYYYTPTGYEKTESGYRRTWEEHALAKPPIRYSVKKVIAALRTAGKWATVKSALIAANYYEEFLGSNYLAADDADFGAACAGLVAGGIVTQAELDAMLPNCHWEAD